MTFTNASMPTSSNNPVKFSHIGGLDGLRALSVLVVMLYHSHLQFIQGGYLGVEIFFVISGFLITSILLNEASYREGKIDLLRFWKRRLLRLLPALLALLFLSPLIGAFLLKEKASQFRFDIIASMFYFENWYQIYSGGSYFADQGFPLLKHIWSLSVEEQFYIVWPLLVAGLLRLSNGSRKPLAYVTVLIFISSFSAMFALSHTASQSNKLFNEAINRVYLGTDTRAFGILTGALLAMTKWKVPLKGLIERLVSSMGIIALAGIIAICSILGAQNTFLYRGGFLLVDLLTLIVILALIRVETSLLKSFLENRLLTWIGQRSYGIYLWHWPIFRLMFYGESGTFWVLLRFVVTFIISEISFRFLESPIRQGTLKNWLSPVDFYGVQFRRTFAFLICCLFMTLLGWSGILLAKQEPYVNEVMESLKSNAAALDHENAPYANISQSNDKIALNTPNIKKTFDNCKIDLSMINDKDLKGIHVTAIGDSVMKGAAIALKNDAKLYLGKDQICINAEESRSFEQAYQILNSYKKKKLLGEIVVIHLGTNNSDISKKHFYNLTDLLSDCQMVLFITAKSDKTSICNHVNTTLTQLVSTIPNAYIFDWKAASKNHPEFFYSDQTHLRPVGAKFYADSIFSQISIKLALAKK